ncbi:Mitochondrial inheritance and actin cytoskeleton organization protein [Handroanthus impetiginosus]|uniref:Mitochondrial inheritance and actin cytoskeleton organization protein n=1 Tax=Handroanthus impetiginosus TaxID=429701 RepID=A0A2G9FZD9_9LAMI|nr:Mitochondrial inheritance and actin cytoskeleton organization protein [Handroanthus impetiginosus]
MASKFGLSGGIPDRRIRPIWDAVDSRQFKNALKLSNALLSKYRNSPYALALKALILERMGKNEEALSVCLNAKEILCSNDSNVLIDDLTLSTIQIVFQRLDHLDKASSCYEHACTKFPNSLELMMGLFGCYVREYSFVKQQQIAIKMYKTAGEERFLLWAVCSIQLQVCCGNGERKLLQLAEGLLKKHIASHGLHEPEALSVYIALLEQQCKYADALEILSGKLGSLMTIEVDKLRLQGRLLAKAGDYAAAADVFQKVLELCPDDWKCFLQYLGCLLEDDSVFTKETDPIHTQKGIESKNLPISEELFDSRISNAVKFVHKLMMEATNNSERGPYLALLEIERQNLLFGKGDADKLAEDLIQYFVRFGHLACFTSDVEIFLQVLDKDNKSGLMKKLVKESEASIGLPTKALGQSINLFKVQNLIGDMFALPVDELEDVAVRMTEMFCKNLPLSKELDAQESMYGEELLSMACSVLVQLFWRTRDFGYLLESIMILEFGLTIQRYVWQYKILLVHLYSYWNSLPLAYERYKSLDVKNILLETESHHILPQMLGSPLWADSSNLLSEYLKFMDDHLREHADLTFLTYRHKNYSKVIEFVQFKDKLQRSSQYLMAKIESSILQLKQNSDNIDEEEGILESVKRGTYLTELLNESKSLNFNEQLKLRPWWTPTSDKNYLLGPYEGASCCPTENLHDQIKQTHADVLKTIEKRSLLPRMIDLSIHSASASVKENIETNGSLVDPKLSLELKILLERYAKILEFPFQDAVELVLGASRGQKAFEAPNLVIIDLMNFAVFLNAWNLNCHEITIPNEDNSDSHSSTWNIVNTLLRKYVIDTIKSAGPIVSSPGSDLPFLVQLITEPLSWHTLIIQSCVRSLFPSGKKKKKGTSVEQLNSQLSNEIQNSIQSLCETIELVTKWLKAQLQKPDNEKFEMIFSSIQRNDKGNGSGKAYEILDSSVSSMKDAEVGDRILQALHSWHPADVVRKIVAGQGSLLSEFLKICELKIKSLQVLRHQW